MKKKMCTSLFLGLGAIAAHAQVPETTETYYFVDSIVTPNFFIAVLAGVLLAMGFQFILTALSVAAGITAIGDIKKQYVKGKYHPNGKDNMHDTKHDVTKDDDDDDGMDTGTMITSGFGAWSVITTVLSLFGATALAINLALIANPVIAITLGLVIWATFFILLFYLESKVVNSLVGGLINTATSGLRASGEAVKSMFSTSHETQMKHVAEDTVDKIRKDFSSAFDPHVINDSIDEFFTRLNKTVDKKVPDYERVKEDIKKIVEESDQRTAKISKESDQRQEQIQKKHGGGGQGKWMAINSVLTSAINNSSNEDSQGKGKVEQLKQLQKELKAAYDEGNTQEESVEKVVAKLTSQEEEQVHRYVEKIKGVLASASSSDMDQGAVQEKVMQVVKNPSVEGPKLAGKLKEIDRETIIRVLSQNTSLDRKQLENYADKVEEIIRKITGTLSGSSGTGSVSSSTPDFGDMKLKLEKEIFKFMNHTGKPDINFSMLTSFLQSKLGMSSSGGSGDSLSSIKRKLTNLDKETVVGIVTSNTSIDQKDIDKVVQSFEDAKTNVLQKVTDLEMEANRKVENLKRRAIIQAENTRKNAAAAAWWLVASALLSAGAAIGGSLLALG
ncbi:hypothetical protein LZ575_10660 [Antarcticibacterium sp. 1MA-6-2]|uniref:hypothetical protein n=1 Tax=Antarcticibacterium sp. 1MA-6-2 TaxID=2908210 RepID=UPI001F28878E|nr:hypothetical protein [Antarcticibacterium sp. 1MA-6-2]UJH92830.1 hypothetical protein LZ575_10660 [Antarcticibacterium sp. 1MA-6-2]